MWKTNITDTVGPEFDENWKTHEDQAAAYYGNAGGLKKNPLAVSRALESAWNEGLKSTTLQELVDSILTAAPQEANKSMQPTAEAAAD